MLVISFGMVKSGSTFSYQIQRDCLYSSGINIVKLKKKYFPDIRWGNGGGVESSHNLVDLENFDIETLLSSLPEDEIFVVKTHSGPSKKVSDLIDKGYISATVTWRDPRECMIALQNIAEKEKALETDRQRFVDSAEFQNALSAVESFSRFADEWLSLENIMPIPYDVLRNNPYHIANNFCEKFSLNIDSKSVVDFYLSNKKRIGEYNKGVPGRWKKEYSLEEIEKMNEKFIAFINKHCDGDRYFSKNNTISSCISGEFPQEKFPPEYWVEELCVYSTFYFQRLRSENPESFEEIACSLTDPDGGLPGFKGHLTNGLGINDDNANYIIKSINEEICDPYRKHSMIK